MSDYTCDVCGRGCSATYGGSCISCHTQRDHDPPPKAPPRSLYLIGSLRNPRVPEIAATLRKVGWDVFDDWYAAGPTADDAWRDYEKARGHDLVQALDGYSCQHVYNFDKKHLERCSAAMLVAPAGKSAHLELGIVIGAKKPGYILLDGDPDRYDAMYAYATRVFRNLDEAVSCLKVT